MSDYTRFIVVTAGRTGSMWLVDALNSHPQIVCFGSVFEARADYVSFDVEGYDNFSEQDRALRNEDVATFLRKRIFRAEDPGTKAIGFKLQYKNVFGFEGLLEHLVEDRPLKVLHLKRRDLLRSLISLRLAETTGHYHRQPLRLEWRTVSLGVRHPLRAIQRLRVRLGQRNYTPTGLMLSKEECEQYFVETARAESHYDGLFSAHDRIDVFYEELVDDFLAATGRLQEFLGVAPQMLSSRQERVNSPATRDLVRNYDELRAAFRESNYERFFA